MAETVTVTIDGEEIEVPKGTNVLQAALDAEICIPNLCYLPGVTPSGSCRVCLVEIERDGWRKMTASCTLEARDGMVIHAHSEDVIRARRNIVELLLAEAPNSQVLRILADRLELDDPRYPERDEDCILCGRCSAACAEIAVVGGRSLIGRGKERHVELPSFNEHLCRKCYECTDRCVIDIQPKSRKGTTGVCGSELSNNEEIPEICEVCILA